MWENLLIILVLVVCAVFIIRRFVRQLGCKAAGGGCGCGCGEGCSGGSAKNGPCEGKE